MDEKKMIDLCFAEFEARMKKLKESYKAKCLRETRIFLRDVSFCEGFDEKEHVKRAFDILKKAGEES